MSKRKARAVLKTVKTILNEKGIAIGKSSDQDTTEAKGKETKGRRPLADDKEGGSDNGRDEL